MKTMEVVRLFDLRTKNGVGIMDMDDDPLGLKNALFYLDKKTGKMTDDDFLTWLKEKRKDGPFSTTERIQLGQDIFTPEFSFLQKKKDILMTGCAVLIDYLIDKNNLI